jgi:hypothetical protein
LPLIAVARLSWPEPQVVTFRSSALFRGCMAARGMHFLRESVTVDSLVFSPRPHERAPGAEGGGIGSAGSGQYRRDK